jgi:hypothetical protein
MIFVRIRVRAVFNVYHIKHSIANKEQSRFVSPATAMHYHMQYHCRISTQQMQFRASVKNVKTRQKLASSVIQ